MKFNEFNSVSSMLSLIFLKKSGKEQKKTTQNVLEVSTVRKLNRAYRRIKR